MRNFQTPPVYVALGLVASMLANVRGDEPPRTIDVWNGAPPGETALSTGEALPRRPNENPPATRVSKITQPTWDVFEPPVEKRIGVGILILPGGGYNYVVTDKEGSEAARWLNGLGVTGFVLRYRTKDGSDQPLWKRPLQDTQRALSLLRAKAADWKLDPNRIGILGFSAGGQVAAMATTRFDDRTYAATDDVDKQSCRPDFALLIYPFNLWDAKTGKLIDEVRPGATTPPTFLVHTHDDRSSSLGSVFFYAALKQHNVPSELHVYQAGGHGYGLRPVRDTNIHTWTEPTARWLARTLTPPGERGASAP